MNKKKKFQLLKDLIVTQTQGSHLGSVLLVGFQVFTAASTNDGGSKHL
jgi:hypothetical protein